MFYKFIILRVGFHYHEKQLLKYDIKRYITLYFIYFTFDRFLVDIDADIYFNVFLNTMSINYNKNSFNL